MSSRDHVQPGDVPPVPSSTGLLPSKKPRTPLAGPYGHPFHPMLVTVPIGSWVASFVFDILARNSDSDQDAFARGAFVLLLIGIVGAILAAVFGLMDLLTIPAGTPAARTGLMHMVLNTLVLVLMIVNALVRRDQGLDSVGNTPLAFTVVALLLLGVSGSLGGKLSYRYGVRVADERTQASGYERPQPITDPTTASTSPGRPVTGEGSARD